jgi:hypothetical protein
MTRMSWEIRIQTIIQYFVIVILFYCALPLLVLFVEIASLALSL